MKAVVTGHLGMIGRNLSTRLTLLNYEVMGIGREQERTADHLINDFNPDVIFHCGAEIYDSGKMMSTNVHLTNRIFHAAASTKCSWVIYLGSSSEYGRMNRAMSEADQMNPSTMYELTKSMGTLVARYSSNVFDYRVRVIRPFSVYGPHEKGHKLIPSLYRAYKQQKEISIVPYPVHDWVYVDDFVAGLLLTMQNDDKFDIINIGTGNQYNNKEVVSYFEKVANYQFQIKYTEGLRTFDSACWRCDTKYSRTKYHIEAPTTLEAGLRKYLAFMESV